MKYPHFYTQVQPIAFYDPLSAFLGAIEKGEIDISYLDCVKFAGHSCPTVAGAYLMAIHGLKALYKDTVPHRGSIHVSMQASEDQGVTGVIANVISFIVGASGASGFKGLNGKMARNNLLSYDTPMQGEVTLTRTDTQQSVTLSYDASTVPADPAMQALMGKCLQDIASEEEHKTFGTLWQKRVEQILLDTEPHTLLTITKD